MPKKMFQRWLPNHRSLKESRMLRWLGPILDDPYLLHINRKSISQSTFIGLFCAYLPIPGQSIIAALLAFWFRTNMPLAIGLIWVTNPITFAPMFFLSYRVGRFILGTEGNLTSFELSWSWISSQGSHIMLPLFTGSLICGLLAGAIGFLGIRLIWRFKVMESWDQRAKKREAQRIEALQQHSNDQL
ncbi:MAG: DUF2062 domain-containing protein [bacterium]